MEQMINAYYKITESSRFREIERVRKKRAATRGRRCFVPGIEIWGKNGCKPAPFLNVMSVRKGGKCDYHFHILEKSGKSAAKCAVKKSRKNRRIQGFCANVPSE